jgi:hypothetical protein
MDSGAPWGKTEIISAMAMFPQPLWYACAPRALRRTDLRYAMVIFSPPLWYACPQGLWTIFDQELDGLRRAPWEGLRLYCNGDIAASSYGIHGYSAPKERLISGLQWWIDPAPVVYMSPSPHHDAYVYANGYGLKIIRQVTNIYRRGV